MIPLKLLRWQVPRRHAYNDVRKELYFNCMNRRFDSVLESLRVINKDTVDYNFLQICLAQSCAWGHTKSIDYIWYKYVMRNRNLILSPELLVRMSNVALGDHKLFMPSQICQYFKDVYRSDKMKRHKNYNMWLYELLRIKVESFACGTMNKTQFREKWKIFIEDMDNDLPTTYCFHVRDFPYLTKGFNPNIHLEQMNDLLYNEQRLIVKNPSSLPMLLNILLLNSKLDISTKLQVFESFKDTHKTLNFADSLLILSKECENDIYSLCRLIRLFDEKEMASLPPITIRRVKQVFDANDSINELMKFPALYNKLKMI